MTVGATERAHETGLQQRDWVKPSLVGEFLLDTFAIISIELHKIRSERSALLSRAVQPALWLLIFGQVFSRIRAVPTGNLNYLTFMTPGILAQSVLFIAIFFGIAVIWEKDLGIVQKLLVSPAPRSALVVGKALSAGVRGLAQGLIVYILAMLLHIHLALSITHIAGVVFFIVLGSALFSTFSLSVACIVKTRERFMGVGQVLTMPLFFASNAIYPVSIMPGWVRVLVKVNPLSYQVDAMRALMVQGGQTTFGIGFDALVMVVVFVFFVILTALLYPNLAK